MSSTNAVKIPPGRFQTLTDEEEWKLKELWAHLLKFWGTPVVLPSAPERTHTSATVASKDSSKTKDEKSKKKLFSKFRKGHKNTKSGDKLNLSTTRSNESIEASYNSKSIHNSLKDLKPEEIYQNFWNMLRTDTPDNLILRFLRARKWDGDKGLAMLANTLHWRLKETHVDDLIMSGDRKPVDDGAKGLALQFELSKAYIRGYDHDNRPVVHIRTRLHQPSAQSLEDIEKYTLIVIEQARLFLTEPVDSASIIFDLSDFSMSNMDYAPVKFMIGIFEAHYPESLGKLFIHKAPWIFPPIWNVVKNWLDPVVASKISFTKSGKDLEKFIDKKYIPKALDGSDDWEPEFIAPNPEDDALLKDTETRDKILAERTEIVKTFVQATVDWIEATDPAESKKFKQEKVRLGRKLAENYVVLDPYIRSRNNYDRLKTLTVKA